MTKGRTAKQRAASKKNLEKARAARQLDLKYQMGNSGMVPLGYIKSGPVGSVLKTRAIIPEGSSLVKSFGRHTNSRSATELRDDYIKFLKQANRPRRRRRPR